MNTDFTTPPRLHAESHNREAPGPALLLLHGAGSSAAVWPAEILALPGVCTIALDLPGHGRSPKPGRRTTRQYASAVADFVAASGEKSVIVAGHSMGGAVGLELAAGGWPWLRGVVLLGSSGRLRVAPSLFEMLSRDVAEAARQIGELSYGPDASADLRQATAAAIVECGTMTMTGDLLACNAFDRRAALPDITLPVLVISGTADRMVPHRHSAATAAALPQAALATVEGAGHFVMLEAPAEVGGLIATYHGELSLRTVQAGKQ